MLALFVSSPSTSGDRLRAAPGWFASRYRAQKLSGTKQPYEVEPQTRSHAGTAMSSPSGECWTKAPQKPLRADEPVTQNDELGLRRVAANNPAGAAGIETHVRFWYGLAACRAGFS